MFDTSRTRRAAVARSRRAVRLASALLLSAFCLFGNAHAQTGVQASALVARDTPLCVCGPFAGEAALGAGLIDGEWPVEVISLAAGEGDGPAKALLRLPPDLPVGRHRLVLEGRPGPAFELVEIDASIDRESLLAGERVPLRIVVRGTRRPVSLRLTNESPEAIRVEGGVEQIAETSGGSENALERGVRAVEPGPFTIDYEALGLGDCPCEAAPVEQAAERDRRRHTSMLPPEADGPCEWVTRSFGALVEGFPFPDLDRICTLAGACVEAQRLTREAALAEAEHDAARRELEDARRRAQRFESFLGSEAAAHNREVDPSLPAHWARVQEDHAQSIARARAASAAARSRAEAAGKSAEAAEAACAKARAELEAELAELEALLAAWEALRIDLARCERCENIERMMGHLQAALARARGARGRCAEKRLAPERDALARASSAAGAAAEGARERAEALTATRGECDALGAEVLEQYQRCFAEAVEGTDHVTGERERGYGYRRSVRTGVRDAELGPVWFDTASDAARFRRSIKDCLRNRRDGRTTRPNALTLRRDARRCEARERRDRRRADRALEEADSAAERRDGAASRLDAARATLAAPFDRLETLLGRWLDLMRAAGEDCALRRATCDEVRRAGETEAGAPECDPAGLEARARDAGAAARRAGSRMNRLVHAGCASGQAAVFRAGQALRGLSGHGSEGPPGALDRARDALAARAGALARARALLQEGRCEEAQAAYARAARAARDAAQACREAERLVARAESEAERAGSLAASCAEREARLVERERRLRERERERQARLARQRAAAAAARARPPAPAPHEEGDGTAGMSRDCAEAFAQWLQANLPEDQRDETLETLRELAQNAAEATGEGIASAAEAAAGGARPSGIGASGIASGIFSLGTSLFYMWMQSELTDAVVQLGNGYDLRILQARLAGVRGRCGETRAGGVTYFWVRIGGEFRAFKISHSRGLEFLGGLEVFQ
jgi:hypothetical protein